MMSFRGTQDRVYLGNSIESCWVVMGDAIPYYLIKAPSLPNLDWSFVFLDVLCMEAAGKSFNPHLRSQEEEAYHRDT